MNRWQVFEYMKQQYQGTGHVPDTDELVSHFVKLSYAEIAEGIAEFNGRLKIRKREMENGEQYADTWY